MPGYWNNVPHPWKYFISRYPWRKSVPWWSAILPGILELSRELAREIGLSQEKARIFLRVLLEEMTLALRRDGRLSFREFGTFRVRKGSQGTRIIFRPSGRLRASLNRSDGKPRPPGAPGPEVD
ncbi:HU family DNA-binding protein [Thermosulfurimonas sp.]|uniref:HU family DNA-binding protein n=1 Tax=Thermosulfurimonas sp. TaxID=2080236 RepID=UPI00342826F4